MVWKTRFPDPVEHDLLILSEVLPKWLFPRGLEGAQLRQTRFRTESRLIAPERAIVGQIGYQRAAARFSYCIASVYIVTFLTD